MNHTHTNDSGGNVMTPGENKLGSPAYWGDLTAQQGMGNAECCHARPMFVRMDIRDLHQSEAYAELNTRINTLLTASSLDELYDCVLTNAGKNVDPLLLGEILKLLWASPEGLNEHQLAELVGETFSAVVAVCRSLASHIIRRNGRLTFSHRSLRAAVENRYLCNGAEEIEGLRLRLESYGHASADAAQIPAPNVPAPQTSPIPAPPIPAPPMVAPLKLGRHIQELAAMSGVIPLIPAAVPALMNLP